MKENSHDIFKPIKNLQRKGQLFLVAVVLLIIAIGIYLVNFDGRLTTGLQKPFTASDQVDIAISNLDSSDPQLQKQAIDLFIQKGEFSINSLSKVLTDPNSSKSRKINAIHVLGRIGSPKAISYLVPFLKNDHPHLRREAVLALGRIKDKNVILPLKNLLNDPDITVSIQAIKSLGELEAQEALNEIIILLEQSNQREDGYGSLVKIAVIEALGKIKSKNASASLVKELQAKNDLTIKNQIVFALGEIKDPSTIAALKDYRQELLSKKPLSKMLLYVWEEALRITEEAIKKIEEGK